MLSFGKKGFFIMKLHAEPAGSNHYIQRFEPGLLSISGQQFTGPVVVTADRILADWCPTATPTTLTAADFEPILALEPELILLGTVTSGFRLDAQLSFGILSRGVGLEVMSTAAACRTYNVLVAEDRRVAAALFPG